MSAFVKRQSEKSNQNEVSASQPHHAHGRQVPDWIPYPIQPSPMSNQALQRLLRTRVIQMKLKINEPGDEWVESG